MHDFTSTRAPNLQPAALHAHARYEPHPDSAEAVRAERQRCAKELEPMCRERASATPSRVARESSSLGTLPSDYVSNRESRDTPSRHGSTAGSRASTQADHVGACAEEEENKGQRQWYDGIINFWTTQISLTIDEGAHRDHLGMSCLLACPWPLSWNCLLLYTDKPSLPLLLSTRTHFSRLPPHLASACNDRCHNRPTVPLAAHAYT